MEYELKHGNSDTTLLQQAIKNGDDLPDFIKNKPYLIDESLQFYLQAFFILETERQVGFGVSPIPISKIISYGHFLGYKDYEDMYYFIHIIRQMDIFVCDFYNSKDKK